MEDKFKGSKLETEIPIRNLMREKERDRERETEIEIERQS